MIYKHKDVSANINSDDINIGDIGGAFYTEDENTAVLNINIEFNNKPYDLTTTDMVPVLDLFCADGSIFMKENVEILSPENGMLQYLISKNVIKHVGSVKAKLFLENSTSSVHVSNFSFTIYDSGVEDAVEKEIKVTLVEDSVRKIMKENALGLLDETFLEKVEIDLKNYTLTNSELFKGEKGDKGDIGPVGPIGPQGEDGPIGATGPQGPIGLQGPQGETGATGKTGPAGPIGATGPQGIQGPKGEKGDIGETGPQGPAGKDGVTPDTTNWQKYKLTLDDGGSQVVSLANNIDSLHNLKPGSYYTTSTPITTGNGNATSSAGFTKVSTRSDGTVKHITFSPFNSSQLFVKRFYQTWSDWELVTSIDTGWIDIPLLNGVVPWNAGQKPKYKLLSIGNTKILALKGAVTNVDKFGVVLGTLPTNVSNLIDQSMQYTKPAATKLDIFPTNRLAVGKDGNIYFYGSSIDARYITASDWLPINETFVL